MSRVREEWTVCLVTLPLFTLSQFSLAVLRKHTCVRMPILFSSVIPLICVDSIRFVLLSCLISLLLVLLIASQSTHCPISMHAAAFEQEWKELGKLIDQDRKMKEFVKVKDRDVLRIKSSDETVSQVCVCVHKREIVALYEWIVCHTNCWHIGQ